MFNIVFDLCVIFSKSKTSNWWECANSRGYSLPECYREAPLIQQQQKLWLFVQENVSGLCYCSSFCMCWQESSVYDNIWYCPIPTSDAVEGYKFWNKFCVAFWRESKWTTADKTVWCACEILAWWHYCLQIPHDLFPWACQSHRHAWKTQRFMQWFTETELVADIYGWSQCELEALQPFSGRDSKRNIYAAS